MKLNLRFVQRHERYAEARKKSKAGVGRISILLRVKTSHLVGIVRQPGALVMRVDRVLTLRIANNGAFCV